MIITAIRIINVIRIIRISGHIVLQLKDQGISYEKMAIVIGLVITLLFGKIEQDVMDRILKSHSSFRHVAERASSEENLYIQDQHVNFSRGCCLAVDESNKLKKDIVLKVISYDSFEKENKVRFYSIGSNHVLSKKAECSSESNIKTLVKELSLIGFMKIISGISDSASAATAGMQHILQGRDNEAITPLSNKQ
jgi:hypothetical protein